MAVADTPVIDQPNREALLPRGVNDFLPEKAGKIGYIEDKIRRVFQLWGFRRIITPLLEFYDVLDLGMGDDLKAKAFRFDDRQTGKLLAIPPDITPQVARIVATRMQGYPLPHRICYHGRVLRHAELQSGRNREIYQSGVELIGLDSPEADAEMIAMAVEILQALGIENFKIDIGQVDFFRGIMAGSGLSEHEKHLLKDAIRKKDSSAVQAILDKTNVSVETRAEISALPRLFGGRKVVEEARQVVCNERSRRALDNITEVLDILDIYGVSEHVTIDLGEIRGLDYHTGITFEGFVGGLGEAVCGGGRYDNLTAKYGFPAPATGFAFNILALLSALEKRPDVEASKTRDFLLFNLKEDRREVLEIARSLRKQGYSAARDIIRRDFENSMAYAQRMNIRHMLVIGGDFCAEDEVYIVRVADGKSLTVRKAEVLGNEFRLQIDP